MRFAKLMTLAAVSSLLTLSAAAQDGAPKKTTVLSIQPLSAMFSVYAGEVEHAIASSWTLGLGASHWSPDLGGSGFSYTSGDVKVRYYPEQHALTGFSFGAQAGYTRVTERDQFGVDGTTTRRNIGGPTIGVALDYNWLLGPPQAFYIGLGLGAKKIFANSKDADATFGYPTARISIGVAF